MVRRIDPSVILIDWNDKSLGAKRDFFLEHDIKRICFIDPVFGPCNLMLLIRQKKSPKIFSGYPSNVMWPNEVAFVNTMKANGFDIVSLFWDGKNYHACSLSSSEYEEL